MKRFEVLALASAAMASSTMPARAQTVPTVRLGIVAVEEGAPAYYAQERGFYKQAGLNVELTLFSNGAAVAQAVVAGALDVGMTNSGSMSLAHERGLPIALIACCGLYTQASPLCHVSVGKNSGIRTAKDLAGKTVGISALKDMLHVSAMDWVDKNGGSSRAVNFIEIPFPQMAEAILTRRIDAAAIVEPFFSRARNDIDQIGYNYIAVNDGKPFQTLGIVGNTNWIAANTAVAQKYAGAIHAATKWANANHDLVVPMLAALTKMDSSVITAYPRVVFAESNRPSLVQPVIDMMVKYGVLQPFDASLLFAT
jgi:NitT/TauT family transport system substrate-binding protein